MIIIIIIIIIIMLDVLYLFLIHDIRSMTLQLVPHPNMLCYQLNNMGIKRNLPKKFVPIFFQCSYIYKKLNELSKST